MFNATRKDRRFLLRLLKAAKTEISVYLSIKKVQDYHERRVFGRGTLPSHEPGQSFPALLAELAAARLFGAAEAGAEGIATVQQERARFVAMRRAATSAEKRLIFKLATELKRRRSRQFRGRSRILPGEIMPQPEEAGPERREVRLPPSVVAESTYTAQLIAVNLLRALRRQKQNREGPVIPKRYFKAVIAKRLTDPGF